MAADRNILKNSDNTTYDLTQTHNSIDNVDHKYRNIMFFNIFHIPELLW